MKAAIDTSIDRFTARAAEEGLLDVAYATADSPFGPLLLFFTVAVVFFMVDFGCLRRCRMW